MNKVDFNLSPRTKYDFKLRHGVSNIEIDETKIKENRQIIGLRMRGKEEKGVDYEIPFASNNEVEVQVEICQLPKRMITRFGSYVELN